MLMKPCSHLPFVSIHCFGFSRYSFFNGATPFVHVNIFCLLPKQGVLEHRPPTPLSKAVAEAATRESLIPPATPPSTAAFTQSSPLNTRAYLHDHALSTAKESLATSSSEGVQRTADPAEQGRSQCTAVWQGVGPENMDIHSTNEFVKSGLAGAAAVPTCVGAVGNRMEDGGKGGENITATAAAAVGAARVEWIEERGGARGVLVDAEVSTAPTIILAFQPVAGSTLWHHFHANRVAMHMWMFVR